MEVAAIKAIPVFVTKMEDSRIWPFVKNGEYSVKSGYHVCHRKVLAGNDSKPGSSHYIDSKVWKSIWSISATKKVVSFIWKATSNILPVMRNLAAKKVLNEFLFEYARILRKLLEIVF